MAGDVSTTGTCLSVDYLGGNCPVQAEGVVDGRPFYFKARGRRWYLEVGGIAAAEPEWRYEEPYGTGPYDAGWMTEDEARAFLEKAVDLYRARETAPTPRSLGPA